MYSIQKKNKAKKIMFIKSIKGKKNRQRFQKVVKVVDSDHFEKYNLDGTNVELYEGVTPPIDNPEKRKKISGNSCL